MKLSWIVFLIFLIHNLHWKQSECWALTKRIHRLQHTIGALFFINPFLATPAQTGHVSILLCLTPDDFTCQGKSSHRERAKLQWVQFSEKSVNNYIQLWDASNYNLIYI